VNDSVFTYDVFLSHSAKVKAVVRPLAERLRADGFEEWKIPVAAVPPLRDRRKNQQRSLTERRWPTARRRYSGKDRFACARKVGRDIGRSGAIAHAGSSRRSVTAKPDALHVRPCVRLGLGAVPLHRLAPSEAWLAAIKPSPVVHTASQTPPPREEVKWTDQEVGFALGKGAMVVPVRFGLDPYGFIGKVQGLRASLEQPSQVATLLADTLLNHPATHRFIRKGLVAAIGAAESYSNAIALSKTIATVKDFSDEEKAMIQHACRTNDQVINANGVVSRICSAIGLTEPRMVADVDDIPF